MPRERGIRFMVVVLVASVAHPLTPGSNAQLASVKMAAILRVIFKAGITDVHYHVQFLSLVAEN